jgi:hypothetical protein
MYIERGGRGGPAIVVKNLPPKNNKRSPKRVGLSKKKN